MKKTAIILFNLGGPDSQQAVQPFLFNLFSDKAIIRLPQPLRYLIAKLISIRRAPIARAIYAKMGGGSPILKNTLAQVEALEKTLNAASQIQYKTFISMRYWHPYTQDTAQAVKIFAPNNIVLLPLYPQFSTTTTASSFEEWNKASDRIKLDVPTKTICCYPQEAGFIAAMADAILPAYEAAREFGAPRILFSAHGLPEKIIKAGDPYAVQCAMTVEALRQKLNIENLDSTLCFQSRVGPMKWISPSTDSEIHRAGHDKVPLVVVPIAFVSEHSETLVEIDKEYRHMAGECGVPYFVYVPTVGTAPAFINGLADIVRAIIMRQSVSSSNTGQRICPSTYAGCICRS